MTILFVYHYSSVLPTNNCQHSVMFVAWHGSGSMKELADGLPTCPLDLDDPSQGFKRISWEGRLFVDELGAGAVATDLWS